MKLKIEILLKTDKESTVGPVTVHDDVIDVAIEILEAAVIIIRKPKHKHLDLDLETGYWEETK